MHKIKIWAILATIGLIGLIQVTMLDYISVLGVKPDFLLISVIFFSLYFSKKDGIIAAILGGIFKDMTSTALFGTYVFGFCLCALMLAQYGRHFYRRKISTQILLCGALYYIIAFIILFLNYAILKTPHAHIYTYHWIILKGSIYTGLISPLLIFILGRFFRNV